MVEMQLGIHLTQSNLMTYTMKPKSQEELEVVGEQCGEKGGVYKALTPISHDGEAMMETCR